MTCDQSDEAARAPGASSFTRPPPATLRVRQAVFGLNTAFERLVRETEAQASARPRQKEPEKN